MRLRFPKIVALLVLSTFLAVSTAGNVFGCTECVGGERSQRVNAFADKECCCDHLLNNKEDSHNVPAIHQLGDEQHGSCLDCSTQQGSAIFSKRSKRIAAAATVATISNTYPLTAVKSVRLVAGKLSPQPLTTTSQTLLAHRTVVLRN